MANEPIPMISMTSIRQDLLRFTSVILTLLACSSGTFGADYSFTSDFQISPNHANTSSNTWQYFYGVNVSNRDGDYTRMAAYSRRWDGAIEAWYGSADGFPSIGVNALASTHKSVRPGRGYIHTSPDGRGLAIAFQAPTDGSYDVSGYVRPGGGDGIRWYLDRGTQAQVLGSGQIAAGVNRNFLYRSVNLQAGERIYLIIDANGHYFSDSTEFEMHVKTTVASLQLTFRPVLTIYGVHDTRFRVEYLDSLAPEFTWMPMTNVVLDGGVMRIIDEDPVVRGSRFYQAIELKAP